MKTLLRFFFSLLYHQFAFTYDWVAASVSFNRWKDWVSSVIPFVEGPRILEIGHGPGHLQRILLSRGLSAVGLDESAQMGRLAQRNLRRITNSQSASDAAASQIAYTQINLTRGLAQHLPFPEQIFDTVVATFPTKYIFDPRTLSEIQRCLCTGGRLVTLSAALPKNRFLEWLFRFTHQSPGEALEIVESQLKEPFLAAGFDTKVETLDLKSGTLLIVLAGKPSQS